MNDRDKPRLELPLDQYLKSELPPDLEDTAWAKLSARRERKASSADVALPLPLGNALLDGDEMAPERARLWRSVRARVHRPTRRRVPRRMALAFAAALGAAVAGAVFAATLHRWAPAPIASVERAGALLATDGRPFNGLDAPTAAGIVRLSDRSEIRLERGGRIEPVLSTSSRFELLLARGAAEFAVTPGGPRRWSIHAGPARVEVVGTVFRVERSPERVDVAVSRGVVLVFGEDVPGRVRRLTAGQSLSVPVRPEPASAKATPASAEPAQPTLAGSSVVVLSKPEPNMVEPPLASNEAAAVAPHSEHQAPRSRRRNSSISLDGPNIENPQQRYAQLGPAGLARETMKATSIEQLLELADVARLSGHPQDAVAPLTRALDAFRGNPQAALAAFTLGRVLLDQLGVAEPAAEAFERAIVLKLPKALRADCYRRLAEAYGRAGNETERARAEGRFQTEFVLPSGALDKVAP